MNVDGGYHGRRAATSKEEKKRLRWDGTCTVFGRAIAAGEEAIHDPTTKSVRCVEHDDAELAGTIKKSTARLPKSETDGILPELVRLRTDQRCTACDNELARGTEVFRVSDTLVFVCRSCTAVEVASGLGSAGMSAGRVADGAARKHSKRMLAAYPMLGEHLIENAKPSAVMHRWDRGADGERVVGRLLDRRVAAGDIVVLHDRTIPGRGGNLDHIVVGSRRITIIDAKHYRGYKVGTIKNNGEPILEINDESAEELLDGILAQRRHVENALEQDLRGCVGVVLAFVGADLGSAGQLPAREVHCMNPKDAVGRAASTRVLGKWPYHFDPDHRQEIAEQLAAAFPPA